MKTIKITESQYNKYISMPLTEGFDYSTSVIKVVKDGKSPYVFKYSDITNKSKKNDILNNLSRYLDKSGTREGFNFDINGKPIFYTYLDHGITNFDHSVWDGDRRTNNLGRFINDIKKYSVEGYVYNKDSDYNTGEIYDRNGNLVTQKRILPNSNLLAFNIFNKLGKDMASVLKHGMTADKKIVRNGSEVFKFGVEQTKRLIDDTLKIGLGNIDIITYVSSSSDFNKKFANALASKCGTDSKVKIISDIVVKNPSSIGVNTILAKNSGLDDKERKQVVTQTELMQIDEEIRKIIIATNNNLKNKKFDNRLDAANYAYQQLLHCFNVIRKKIEGEILEDDDGNILIKIDPMTTKDGTKRNWYNLWQTTNYPFRSQDNTFGWNNGKTKKFSLGDDDKDFSLKASFNPVYKDGTNKVSYYEFILKDENGNETSRRAIEQPSDCIVPLRNWQIKAMYDKFRRYFTDIYKIDNTKQEEINAVKGKVVVVVDDNMSSGATLDAYCVLLQKMGAKTIIPITFGDIGDSAVKPAYRSDTYDLGDNVDNVFHNLYIKTDIKKEHPVYNYNIRKDSETGKYHYYKALCKMKKNKKGEIEASQVETDTLLKLGGINNAFDDCKKFKYGFARIFLKGKGWNFINTNGYLLSPEWFKECNDFNHNAAEVMMGKEHNYTICYIDSNGKLHNREDFQNREIEQ